MKALLASFCLLFSFAAFAQPQFTDSTFGTNGKVIENTSTADFEPLDAVMQTDNKSVVLAQAYYNSWRRVVLIRYNTNGTLDATFSGNGIADDAPAPNSNFYPSSIKLQPDGKILVCGDCSTSGFVMRYNADGTFDNTFGTGGILYLPSFTIGNTTRSTGKIYDVAVLSTGKIMLLTDHPISDEDLSLICINANGTIDNTFGTNGTIWHDILSSNGYTYKKIVAQADGKIIVAGDPNIYQPSEYGFTGILLLRLNANGTIDNTYGTSGKLLLNAGMAYGDVLTDIALRTDGKLIVSGVGTDYINRYDYLYLIRIGTNGTIDNSFGTNGKQFIYFSNSNFASYEGQINLQSNGQILAAGYSYNTAGYYTMSALRLTADGIPDNTFGVNGVAPLSVNQNGSYGIAPLQQTDGKVVVAGVIKNNNTSSVSIGRLTSTGQVDNTINTINSAAIIGSDIDDESGVNIHVQPDQKLVNVSVRYSGYTYDLCVKKYLPTGQPDASFGTAGKTFIDFPGEIYRMYSGLMANGKITIVPDFADYVNRGSIALARVNADGSMDAGFGTNGKLFSKTKPGNVYNPLLDAKFYADGKILLLVRQAEGDPTLGTEADSTFIIRLDANGNYDNTFGTNGKLYVDQPGLIPHLLCLQSDGKIILGGSHDTGSGFEGFTMRFLPDGVYDNTFYSFFPPNQVTQINQQTDGKIIVTTYGYQVFRFTTNGDFDLGFAELGLADMSAYFSSANNDLITDVQVDTNQIVVMGRYFDSTLYKTVTKVVRLTYDGTPDSTFGQYGAATSDIGVDGNGLSNMGMAIQADKKIVITGFNEMISNNENHYYSALTRLKGLAPTSGGRTYTFTGTGNWSNPANWSGGIMPPSTITAGNSIIINTPGGQCIIDIPVTVQQGASFTVSTGSMLLLPGNLTIQQ